MCGEAYDDLFDDGELEQDTTCAPPPPSHPPFGSLPAGPTPVPLPTLLMFTNEPRRTSNSRPFSADYFYTFVVDYPTSGGGGYRPSWSDLCGGEYQLRGTLPPIYIYLSDAGETYDSGILGGEGDTASHRAPCVEVSTSPERPLPSRQCDFSNGEKFVEARTPLPAAHRLVPGSTAGSPFSPAPPGAPPTLEPQCARGGCYDRIKAVTSATNCPPLPAAYCPPCAPSFEEHCPAAVPRTSTVVNPFPSLQMSYWPRPVCPRRLKESSFTCCSSTATS